MICPQATDYPVSGKQSSISACDKCALLLYYWLGNRSMAASETGKWDFMSGLLERTPLVLILLGTVVVVIGLAGGVTYKSWLDIKELWARLGTCLLGVMLLIVGVLRSGGTWQSDLDKERYGITIEYPQPGADVSEVDVQGNIKRRLPVGYTLRVFRIFLDSSSFVPVGIAQIDYRRGTWIARGCNIGGSG